MLTETFIVVTLNTCTLCKHTYCTIDIVHTFETTAAIRGNAVYLDILTAKFYVISSRNGCSLCYCHEPLYKKHYHQLYYYNSKEHTYRIDRGIRDRRVVTIYCIVCIVQRHGIGHRTTQQTCNRTEIKAHRL